MIKEIIIIAVVVVFVLCLILMFASNSKKIKLNAEAEKKKEEAKKQETANPKQPTKQNELSTKDIMKEVSNQSEDYIKNMMIKDDEKYSDIQLLEVSEEEINKKMRYETKNNRNNDQAIVLGVKKQSVHIIDQLEEDDGSLENTNSILQELDEDTDDSKKSSKGVDIQLDDFEEDESVGEEFVKLSNRMKIVMISDVLKRKDD